jgi:hypothetical protein
MATDNVFNPRKKVNHRQIRQEILDIMRSDDYTIVEAVYDWACLHNIPLDSLSGYLDKNLMDKLKSELYSFKDPQFKKRQEEIDHLFD